LLVDLRAVPDPQGVAGGPGTFFTFPFFVVGNDNNLPSSAGRTAGVPDDNEYALIQVDEDLDVRTNRR
jgi:hypothetical protein